VELEREARSALTEALPQIMETYGCLAAHPVPTSLQGKLPDALRAELEAEEVRGKVQRRATAAGKGRTGTDRGLSVAAETRGTTARAAAVITRTAEK